MKCGNCGQEEDALVFSEPPNFWEFWKKGLCSRCDYNQKHGTDLDVEQWNARIISPLNIDIKEYIEASYEEFIYSYTKDGWHADQIMLTHYSCHDIKVETYKTEKDTTARILGIECPSQHVITICGVGHSKVDPRDFAKTPHLYTIPHEFSILCYDKDSNELPPETIIKLEKIKPSEEVVPMEQVLYGDLSLKTGGRFKRKEERYYFPKGIILYGRDWLFLTAVKPGITIDRIELFMRCDFLTRSD